MEYHLDYQFFKGKSVGKFVIIQAGRLLGNDKTYVAPHIQNDYYELTIVTGGEGVITTNSISTPVKKNDIYISLPSDIHEISSSKDDPIEYDFFTFNSQDEFYTGLLNALSKKIVNPENRIITDNKIPFLVNQAIGELDGGSDLSDIILGDICELICIYLSQVITATKTQSDDYHLNRATKLCYKIMNYIDNNIYNIKKLDELADITNYNYSYISSLFKKTVGKTIAEYYKSKRLFTAKKLIEENKLKGVEIAELLNFSSYFSFSRAFKEEFLISPREYQKKCKTERTRRSV